ncbi:MAG TPA: rhamnogalacturonan acetylesterase [Longimicrobiaceae bacterium]|nr:rhamnogalacturonan acetylesterase [Longimicrobiaceae bacterium]
MRTRWLLLPVALLALSAMAPEPITLFLAGDSTMAQKLVSRRPETGWGEALQQYFDVDQVRVVNLARNGRSTKSFITEGRWEALLGEVKPGDYVFIQFGHNDEKRNKPAVYADPHTDYPRNLDRFVRDVRARGGHPVLLTPVARRKFAADGTVEDTHGAYPDAVRAVARRDSVPLVDMQQRSTEVLARCGEAGSRLLYNQLEPGQNPNYPQGVHDDTHFSPLGAQVMASLAVQGVRDAVPDLARYLDPHAPRAPALPAACR